MAEKIQLRRDNSAAWTLANPVLSDGEIGWERDTYQFKVGDGVTAWNALAYGGIQGPQGPHGVIDPAQFFQVANLFYEIAEDETAKQAARTNLGLAAIDGGTFN